MPSMSEIIIRQSEIDKLTETLKQSYKFWDDVPVGSSYSIAEFKAEYLYELGYRRLTQVVKDFTEYLKDKLIDESNELVIHVGLIDKYAKQYLRLNKNFINNNFNNKEQN